MNGRGAVLLAALLSPAVMGHDAHGRSNAPAEARRLKNPAAVTVESLQSAGGRYQSLCAGCHGADGKARTKAAAAMAVRPTDLTHYLMESMKDGEIYWVVTHGIDKQMPAFAGQLDENQRWEMVNFVRGLRRRQRAEEKAKLGPYEWNLPPGFPFPNVPADNPMTAEKVALGRYLFYDRPPVAQTSRNPARRVTSRRGRLPTRADAGSGPPGNCTRGVR